MHKNKFSVYFKGVRGSYPVPDKNFLNYGGNTACIYLNVNNHIIILDAGSGIANAGHQILEERIMSQDKSNLNVTILLSHLHFDHLLGLPFFAPIHSPKSAINIFGMGENDEDLKNSLEKLMFKKFFPLELNEIKSDIKITAINEKNNDLIIILKDGNPVPIIEKASAFDKNKIEPNDVVISAMYSKTHPSDGVIFYKIEYANKSLVYATDTESYSDGNKALANFARNTDLLIHDSQYTSMDYSSIVNSKQGFGHSSYDMAIQQKEQSHAKSLAFFHYDPTYDDNKLDEIKKAVINKSEGLVMPTENQEIVLL